MEKAPPLVLLGGADAHDLVLVEMLIDDYPNIIFVVLTSLNPIIPLGPAKSIGNTSFPVLFLFLWERKKAPPAFDRRGREAMDY